MVFYLGECFSRFLGDADFLTAFNFETDTSNHLCFWIYGRYVGNVNCLLHLNNLTGSRSLFLDVFFYDVNTFHENTLCFFIDRKDFTFLAFIFSGDNSYDVSTVNFHMGYL